MPNGHIPPSVQGFQTLPRAALRSRDAASPPGGASLPISDSAAYIITTGWSVCVNCCGVQV